MIEFSVHKVLLFSSCIETANSVPAQIHSRLSLNGFSHPRVAETGSGCDHQTPVRRRHRCWDVATFADLTKLLIECNQSSPNLPVQLPLDYGRSFQPKLM
jgi:hypothetical protein